MNFEEVQEQIQSDDMGKWDTLVNRAEVTMRDGKVVVPEAFGVDGDCPRQLFPTPWATTQLCQRLGIPTAYFKRCPPDLQDAQFNYWVKQAVSSNHNGAHNGSNNGSTASQPEAWLMRARRDVLRSVLSDRYARMDNAPLLDCLEPLLGSRFQVGGFALTDESMHLRIVDPTVTREVLPDDQVMVGVHIANSEVGKRAVTVDALVYRLVCSNGLIRLVKGKSLLYQRHVFRSTERLKRALADAVGEAFNAADTFIERLMWATGQRIKDIDETVKRLVERWGLTQEFQEQVTMALLNEPYEQYETVYGLANAFTSVAQRLPADDRYRIEVLAGQLVERGLPG